jgi:hypothetical protein
MVARIKNLKRWQKVIGIFLSFILILTLVFNIWAGIEGRSTRSLLLELGLRVMN